MLAGLRIIDLSWVLGGPFAGQLLAQLGAEVVKVEPPSGDMSRTIPPHAFEGESSFFLSVNRGKKSVVLDIKTPLGLAAFHDLVRESDAVIYGFAPDVPKRLGVDYETLEAVNPRIVVGELIGLHDKPPFDKAPAFDLVIQALSGLMSITGEQGGAPVRVGYQVADLVGGLYLALGVAGALVEAQKRGAGRKVQVSLLDCQLAMLTWQAENFFISGEVPTAQGARHHMIAPSDAYVCADGKRIAISPTGDAFWRSFCRAVEQPELADDERFTTGADRIANVDALTSVLADIFRQRPRDEWSDMLFAARIPSGPVNSVKEALDHPLAVARSMVETVAEPKSSKLLRFLGSPFKYEGAPLSYPPALGQATEECLRKICGYGDDLLEQMREQKAALL
jgi:CoA:oxalate CoA-transferase